MSLAAVESLKASAFRLITDRDAQLQALMTLSKPIWIWLNGKTFSFCEDEQRPHGRERGNYQLGGILPSLGLHQLGDRSFLDTHHLRYPYMAGPMAHGIANTTLVVAMARAGMLGSYGSAGQSHEKRSPIVSLPDMPRSAMAQAGKEASVHARQSVLGNSNEPGFVHGTTPGKPISALNSSFI